MTIKRHLYWLRSFFITIKVVKSHCLADCSYGSQHQSHSFSFTLVITLLLPNLFTTLSKALAAIQHGTVSSEKQTVVVQTEGTPNKSKE